MKTDYLPPVVLNHASGKIKKQSLSTRKAKEVLGWVAQHSPTEGLGKTVEWYLALLRSR